MTVKLRLVLAFSILILMSVILGVVSIVQITKVNGSLSSVVDDRLPKMMAAMGIDHRRVSVERDIGQLIQLHKQSERDEVAARMDHDRALNREAYQYLKESLTSETARELLAKTHEARIPQSEHMSKMIELAKSGQMDVVTELYLSTKTRDLSSAYRHALNEFVDYQKELNEISAAEGSKTGDLASAIVLVMLAISLIIGVIFFVWILRVVVRPVVGMQLAMQEVVRTGQFNKQVKVLNRDEIGLSVEALNSLLKSMENIIGDANHTVGALAQGDFSQRITREYVGDLNKLKVGINSSADNITSIMTELARVMKLLSEGQFDVVVDTDAKGEYGVMLTNTSEAMSAINEVIVDINNVMACMQDGRFQERVLVDACGELDTMKDRINSSMQDLDNAMSEIIRVVIAQSEGDLTNHIDMQFHGDLETLKDAINTSSQKLIDVVSKVVNTSSIVNNTAEDVAIGSSDLSQRVQEQAAALEETSATMDEMSSAVEANTENSQRAVGVAQGVQTQAHEGSGVMHKTIEAMNEIQKSSHKIADIVALIDGIAFQTNLLALNAAVEAARAGEHGRGFAVVAGEVRALAQRSADAAKDIKTLIDESVIRIDQGTQLAEQSGKMLGTINESISSVSQMIQQIASASLEQTEGIGQVNIAISQIDQVTQQNAALVEQTSAAAVSMSEQSNIMRQDMLFFKTGRSNTPSNLQAPKKRTGLLTDSTQKAPSKVIKPTVKKSSHSDDEWSEF